MEQLKTYTSVVIRASSYEKSFEVTSGQMVASRTMLVTMVLGEIQVSKSNSQVIYIQWSRDNLL